VQAIQRIAGAGAIPMISWEPWQGLDPIARGEWDGYIREYADAVAATRQPLFLRFAHEMNLQEIPWFGRADTFRAAWRRVRAIFDEAGADGVRWVWSPYVNGARAADLRDYFPGAELVDWLALDGYEWGGRRWWERPRSFDRIFGTSLAALRTLGPGAPVMLAEIGCAPGPGKGAWMRDALLRAIPRYEQIRAVAWFNEHRPEHADWRIDSSPDALAAWREAVADQRYSLTGAELASQVTG
jgi:beta-mannanase